MLRHVWWPSQLLETFDESQYIEYSRERVAVSAGPTCIPRHAPFRPCVVAMEPHFSLDDSSHPVLPSCWEGV